MKKVLIVEDDAVVAHVYRLSLEKRGYKTETANDGPSGLQRAQEYQPDAILLDLMLPKMNGIELLKQIRTQKGFTSLPVIVLTNAYVPNMVQEALAAGASQVFNKANVTPQHILDSLDQLLNGGKVVITAVPLEVLPLRPPPPMEHPGSPPPPANYGYNDNFTSAKGTARTGNDDSGLEEIRRAFVDANAGALPVLRKLVQDAAKASDEAAREPVLVELYRKIHGLTGGAGLAGFADIAQMASVLEVLIKELIEQPKTVNQSTLRSVASSVDFIGELFKIARPRSHQPRPIKVLIVDDECLSRRAIVYALKKAHLNFEPTDVEDPAIALQKAAEKTFDLILLDVQMPGINGFDLCSKIRAFPSNKATPIIFVTSLSDFKSRAKSILSGGSDLIAKPFLFVELALKVTTILLRKRLDPKRKAA